jgi:phospholipid/cholesterol/gamma-HCH transport system substrate-binding protein
MKYFTKEVKIGITGIMALCIFIYGMNYLKGIQLFKPTVYFYVKYNNVNNLVKSSPVFAYGYQVGVVRNIHYDYAHPGNLTVEVGLNADMRIPKGSSAELVAEMLGGVKMNILMATDSQEYYMIGDTIPGVINNGLIGNMTTIMPQMERIIPQLDSILTSLHVLLNDPNAPATLRSVRNTAEHIELTSLYLKNMMRKDIPQLTEKLNIIEDNVVVISDNLKDIDFALTFKNMEATVASVKMFTDDLGNKESSLHLLLTDPRLYNNLNTTLVTASDLLEDLKRDPKRYVHFSLIGKK